MQQKTIINLAQNFAQQTGAVIPESGFLKLHSIIGDKKRGIVGVFPVSRSAWYQGISGGIYPQGVKLGARSIAWRVEDVRALLAATGAEV